LNRSSSCSRPAGERRSPCGGTGRCRSFRRRRLARSGSATPRFPTCRPRKPGHNAAAGIIRRHRPAALLEDKHRVRAHHAVRGRLNHPHFDPVERKRSGFLPCARSEPGILPRQNSSACDVRISPALLGVGQRACARSDRARKRACLQMPTSSRRIPPAAASRQKHSGSAKPASAQHPQLGHQRRIIIFVSPAREVHEGLLLVDAMRLHGRCPELEGVITQRGVSRRPRYRRSPKIRRVSAQRRCFCRCRPFTPMSFTWCSAMQRRDGVTTRQRIGEGALDVADAVTEFFTALARGRPACRDRCPQISTVTAGKTFPQSRPASAPVPPPRSRTSPPAPSFGRPSASKSSCTGRIAGYAGTSLRNQLVVFGDAQLEVSGKRSEPCARRLAAAGVAATKKPGPANAGPGDCHCEVREARRGNPAGLLRRSLLAMTGYFY